MTPKSLLRLPQASSRLEDLSEGRWHPILDDPWAAEHTGEIRRIVLCTGKVYYDLLSEAGKASSDRPALIRLEQLYSFPWAEARATLARYPRVEELVWVQEEPRNMGAWTYLAPKLQELASAGLHVGYVGRPERASPAEGYPAAHAAEQSRIIRDALDGTRRPPLLPTMALAGDAKG
jgi:2-oxoglutarate dehydrogenase E1 component